MQQKRSQAKPFKKQEQKDFAIKPKKNQSHLIEDSVIFYGVNQVNAIIASKTRKIYEVMCTKQASGRLKLAGRALSVSEVSMQHLDMGLGLKSKNHQGMVCVTQKVKEPALEPLLKTAKFVVVLNGVTDIGNIGAIIRSCVAFGVDLMITNKQKMPDIQNNPDLCKTSSGLSEQLQKAQVLSLPHWVSELKNNGFTTIALDHKSKLEIEELSFKLTQCKAGKAGKNKIALVLGSEGFGIEQKVASICDFAVKIDTKIESLNVASAAAIAIFALSKLMPNH
jgi:23S rRNA (guanosine2251-2'-O)-methyltransferase